MSLSIAAYSLFVKRPFANFNNNQISHNGSIFVHPTLNLNIESALPPFIDEETHIVVSINISKFYDTYFCFITVHCKVQT